MGLRIWISIAGSPDPNIFHSACWPNTDQSMHRIYLPCSWSPEAYTQCSSASVASSRDLRFAPGTGSWRPGTHTHSISYNRSGLGNQRSGKRCPGSTRTVARRTAPQWQSPGWPGSARDWATASDNKRPWRLGRTGSVRTWSRSWRPSWSSNGHCVRFWQYWPPNRHSGELHVTPVWHYSDCERKEDIF